MKEFWSWRALNIGTSDLTVPGAMVFASRYVNENRRVHKAGERKPSNEDRVPRITAVKYAPCCVYDVEPFRILRLIEHSDIESGDVLAEDT